MIGNMLASGVLANVAGVEWGWVVWIIIGAVAGWLAGVLVEGTGLGIIGDIILGIIGAFIGGIILGALGGSNTGILWTFIAALAGAIVVLVVSRLVFGMLGVNHIHRARL